MIIEGARVYNEGVEIGHDSEEKIRQIMTTVKTVSPSAEVSIRILKSGSLYEALLWGKAERVPIGVYHRGPSASHVLDCVYRNVKKQCLKTWKLNGSQPRSRRKSESYGANDMALAG